MKAAQISNYGGPEELITVTDAPKPTINPDQVLVEVHAAGVNPFDIKVREGHARQMAELRFPATLGGDFAGVVAETGAQVTHVKPGDAVYGQAAALSGKGSFAEYTPVAGASVGPKPRSLDFLLAAALPLVGVSAYQAIVETLMLEHGQKILIHGGAGGIGSVAIQLAKHLGAYVATTAGAEQKAFVKDLGADLFVDYKSENFQDKISDYDAVFDTVGGEIFKQSLTVLKPGGAIVTMASADQDLAKEHGVGAHAQFTRVNTARLAKVAELADQGIIKVPIDKIFPFDEAGQALGYLQAGQHKGKVVLKIKD